ncbi:MAG: hypothetical protein ACE5ES_05090 [Candidatus Nanoarchaeia archaeon]
MNIISRAITGIAMIILGIFILSIPFLAFFEGLEGRSFVSWIYGLPMLIIGIVILFNTKEDKIEQIKTKK